jgi:hypothetical protein
MKPNSFKASHDMQALKSKLITTCLVYNTTPALLTLITLNFEFMNSEQIIIYQTADGQTAIDVKLVEETCGLRLIN